MEQEVNKDPIQQIEDMILKLVQRHGSYPAGALTREVQRSMTPSKRQIRTVINRLTEEQIITCDWQANFKFVETQ